MPIPSNSPRREPRNKNVWRYAGLATEMLAALGIATWVGYWLDEKTGLPFPLLVIIFPVLALGVILWQIIKATGHNE